MKSSENINQHEPDFLHMTDTDTVNTTVEQDERGEYQDEGGESTECPLQLLCASTQLYYMGQRGYKYSNNSKATRTIQYAVNSLNTSQKQVSITN
jgi:hypothetical protein